MKRSMIEAKRLLSLPLISLIISLFCLFNPTVAQQSGGGSSKIILDDFESYTPGNIADKWKYITKSGDQLPAKDALEPGEQFNVEREDGNQFLRVETQNESIRLSKVNGKSFDWNIKELPYLSWEWRALHLPENANEKEKNDSGGAIYVTFGTDWLGRPKSIKYTYSSSLPIGTKVEFGPLTVIVVATPDKQTVGQWHSVKRNLVKDYRDVFGGFLKSGTPPDHPLSITIWSDSDSTNDTSKVDFDNIELLAR